MYWQSLWSCPVPKSLGAGFLIEPVKAMHKQARRWLRFKIIARGRREKSRQSSLDSLSQVKSVDVGIRAPIAGWLTHSSIPSERAAKAV